MLIHKPTGKVYANVRSAIEDMGKKSFFTAKHYHDFFYVKKEKMIHASRQD